MNKKESRAKLFAEMEALSKLVESEKRSFSEEENKKFNELESQIRGLDVEIEAEERSAVLNGFAQTRAIPKETSNVEEKRAAEFANSGRMELRAVLGTGTIAKPSKAGGVNGLGESANSIVDDVNAVAISGNGSWEVAYKDTEASAADVTDGSKLGGTGAVFKFVSITPKKWAVVDTISKMVKTMTPVNYENAVKDASLIALRAEAANKIISAITSSDLCEAKEYSLDADFVRNAVLGFRAINGKGNVKLYISQSDLATLGKIRGTQDKKAVYEISFDAGTTTSGTIKDGGTAVQFRIIDGLSAGTQLFGQPLTVDMPMWDNYRIETDEHGEYFASDVMAVKGVQTAGVDLVCKYGMQKITQPAG